MPSQPTHPPAPAAALTPTQQRERIQILDVLRGVAVFGILIVNIVGFAYPSIFPGYEFSYTGALDTLTDQLITILAADKFYSIFAFLFGLGFALQFMRAEARGQDIRAFYPRRLAILFAIGLLHALLLWPFDILRLYALLGFVLLLFRRRSDRTLVIWAAFFLVAAFLIKWWQFDPAVAVIPASIIPEARAAYTSPHFAEVVRFHGAILAQTLLDTALIQGPAVMALFLLGLLLGRRRFFEQLADRRAALRGVFVGGLGLGLAMLVGAAITGRDWLWTLGTVSGAILLAAVYVSGVALAFLKHPTARIFDWLAGVGRMALTHYILQSVICAWLFYGFGLGLYERVPLAGLMAIAPGIYLAQVALSAWWLRRFRYGPLEWVWRSLTYGQRQPLRRSAEG